MIIKRRQNIQNRFKTAASQNASQNLHPFTTTNHLNKGLTSIVHCLHSLDRDVKPESDHDDVFMRFKASHHPKLIFVHLGLVAAAAGP